MLRAIVLTLIIGLVTISSFESVKCTRSRGPYDPDGPYYDDGWFTKKPSTYSPRLPYDRIEVFSVPSIRDRRTNSPLHRRPCMTYECLINESKLDRYDMCLSREPRVKYCKNYLRDGNIKIFHENQCCIWINFLCSKSVKCDFAAHCKANARHPERGSIKGCPAYAYEIGIPGFLIRTPSLREDNQWKEK